MAAYSASLRGASRIFIVDRVPERLTTAEKIPGCTAIDFSKGDAVDMIIKENGGKMVDRSVDAVGYQASAMGKGDESGEVPNVVLESCIRVTRPTGGIGVPGLYVPSDPGAPDEKSGKGMLAMSFGKLFEKVLFSFLLSTLSFSQRPLRSANFSTHTGPHNRHRPMQRESIQSIFARPDYFGQGGSEFCG